MQLRFGMKRFSRAALVSAWLVALVATALAAPVLAQSPSPTPAASPQPSVAPSSDVTITAVPLLGGHVRPGAWTAVDVLVQNDGPQVDGELRIRGPQQTQSRYGVEVSLANGARQRFTLYAQTAIFGSRVNVDLVSNDQTIATQQVAIKSHDAYTPIVAVIAERPENIIPAVTDAMVNPNTSAAQVIQLTLADLPPRVEAWAALDRIVLQDVDLSTLTSEQKEAMRLWIGAGGRLTVVGGTAPIGGVQALGEELLPFDPSHSVDVQPQDLNGLLGGVPSTATALPAFAGTLAHGTVLARSGDEVVAAQAPYGRGFVTLIGFDPSTAWIADSNAADALWHRLMPQATGPVLNPLAITDDSQIVYALQNLPSIDLPPIEQLFGLLIAYILLIGPINYLILRRIDKREWAWVTIPALVVVFAVGSYGLGATLKGSDVIVNQITVVRAAQGTGRGIGQAYIGVYSPSRRTFDVRIPGGALLSNPASTASMGLTETPLDVVFGQNNSRLRNFEVGFGVLRGFRAEAPADAPEITSDLTLRGGKLQGTITNTSDQALENVAVLYNGGTAVLPALGAGETKDINLDVTNNPFFGYGLSEQIFGSTFPRDSVQARKVTTRRAVIDQLFPWGSQGSADTPLMLAWHTGPVLDVELAGDTPNRVGEGLYMIPLGVTLDTQQVFSDQMLKRSILETTAANGWADGSGMYLSRGTMTVEVRPSAFDGSFVTSSLEIALTQGDFRQLRGNGAATDPLPPDQQPPQDDPLTEGPQASLDPNASPAPDCANPPCDDVIGNPEPGGKPPVDADPNTTLPAYQMFDRTSGQWVEFPQAEVGGDYEINNAQNYVDESGAILFRFINRTDAGQFGEDQKYFQLQVRLEGSIGS